MDQAPSEMRARLLGVKLTALVRQQLAATGVDPASIEVSPAVFPGGAALLVGSSAWVLLDENPARGLGGAVAWSVRNGATELHLLAETATSLLARRAAAFRLPITVWHVDERVLLPAVAEPLDPPAVPSTDHLAHIDLIAEGGAIPVVEHGVVAGEVRGLEVCRVVTDDTSGTSRLEVGIGAHDREAFSMLHGGIPTVEALSGVVESVRPHREPGAPLHPLNRLAGERELRHRAIEQPDLVGAGHLVVAAPPLPRENLKDAVPCVATGTSLDGRPIVAVFSSGVDLDVVPFAADARIAHRVASGADQVGADGLDLVIVVPARDRLAVTVMLAELLIEPARVVGWES
jgi:hypothetical protein